MQTLWRGVAVAGLGLALIAGRANAGEAKDKGYGSLTVAEVAALIAAKDADVFDNNSQDRWQKSHVPGAKWVAFNAVKASDLPQDKTRKLVFYCANTH
jgi:rhodanese-related sulfurtransferase